MIDPRTRFLLEDMLEYARAALDFIKGMSVVEFAADLKTVYATTRAVEVVGEAAAQIGKDVQASLPNLPWKQAIGMRNKLVHGYRATQSKTIFETVRDDFPGLVAELERLLKEGGRS